MEVGVNTEYLQIKYGTFTDKIRNIYGFNVCGYICKCLIFNVFCAFEEVLLLTRNSTSFT